MYDDLSNMLPIATGLIIRMNFLFYSINEIYTFLFIIYII